MAILDVKKDLEALSLTITAEFDADIARVWELWVDPRKLERWWGPSSYPVSSSTLALCPGARFVTS
jgi:uncharacterized protein YndB with AHSA1/START domain